MEIIKNISIIFMSIFFESLPFLLLGAIISAIIETFISNETMAKIIPKNKILGSLVGMFLGLFLPACDCAVIPVAKRLIKKEVPINVAVSFMIASPIINPVVLFSTYTAFSMTNMKIFYYRIIFGIAISLIVGILMGVLFNNKDVLLDDKKCDKCHCHEHKKKKLTFKDAFISIINNSAVDLFDVVKYLMFGALIASFIQVILPRDIIMVFNNNQILSIIVLMVLAYLVSLCSTSDSFVGKSLLNTFSTSGVVAYLILGPMIDIKNTLVLLGNYKKSFVLVFISLIFIMTFVFSCMVIGL